jgi:hypothetical protein
MRKRTDSTLQSAALKNSSSVPSPRPLPSPALEPSFREMQNSFFHTHCVHFEDTDENKLIYTQIFQEYVSPTSGPLTASG